jgi:hypothetical protein
LVLSTLGRERLLTNNTDRAIEPSAGREGQCLGGSRFSENEAHDASWWQD